MEEQNLFPQNIGNNLVQLLKFMLDKIQMLPQDTSENYKSELARITELIAQNQLYLQSNFDKLSQIYLNYANVSSYVRTLSGLLEIQLKGNERLKLILQGLQNRYTVSITHVSTLTTDFSNIQSEISQFRGTIWNIKETLKQYNDREIEIANEAYFIEQRMISIESEISQLQIIIPETKDILQNLQLQYSSISQQLFLSNETLSNLTKLNRELSSQASELKNQVNSVQNQLRTSELELLAEKSSTKSSFQHLNNLQKEISDKKKEFFNLREVTEERITVLTNYQNETSIMSKQNLELEKEVLKIQRSISELEKEKNQLYEVLGNSTYSYEAVKRRNKMKNEKLMNIINEKLILTEKKGIETKMIEVGIEKKRKKLEKIERSLQILDEEIEAKKMETDLKFTRRQYNHFSFKTSPTMTRKYPTRFLFL